MWSLAEQLADGMAGGGVRTNVNGLVGLELVVL